MQDNRNISQDRWYAASDAIVAAIIRQPLGTGMLRCRLVGLLFCGGLTVRGRVFTREGPWAGSPDAPGSRPERSQLASRWSAETSAGRASMAKMGDTETAEMQDQTKEVIMRKVIVVEFLSVDGVMESPEEWAFSYSNDEME